MSSFSYKNGKIISDTPCPHCNKQSTYEEVYSENDYVKEKTLVWDDLGVYLPYQIDFSIYRCEFCGHFRILGERIRQGYENRTVFEYPMSGFPDLEREKINNQIVLENLDEGMRCLIANAPKGAIVNFRRALQAAVLVLGGKGSDLCSQIDDLYKKEIIRGKTKEIAHKVRAFGNLGAHPYEIKFDDGESFNELTLDDAVQAAKMLLLFLEDAFIFTSGLDEVDKRLDGLNA